MKITKLKESDTILDYINESIEFKYDAIKVEDSVNLVESFIKPFNNFEEYKSSYTGRDTEFTKACKYMFLQNNNHFKTLAFMQAVYFKYALRVLTDDIEAENTKFKIKASARARIRLAEILECTLPHLTVRISAVNGFMESELAYIENLKPGIRAYCKALFHNKKGNIKSINIFEREVLQYILLYYGNNKVDVMKYLNISNKKFGYCLPEIKKR